VLGQLIPPSVPMILYAWVTWQSVAACFLSTVGPGILTIITYCTINFIMCRRMPSVTVRPFTGFREQAKEVAFAARHSTYGLLMPLIILGGIYGGFTTPTESAAVAVLYSLPVGFFIYKTLTVKNLADTLVKTTTTTGVIILMFVFVVMLGRIYTMHNVPQRMVEFITSISNDRIVILAMVNVFLIIIGMLMDDFSGTLLAAPLLLPLMSAIGVHPIHFAAIMGTNLGLGNVTPPTAPILYLGGRVGGVSFDKMVKPATIFMIFGSLPVVIITTYWPDLSLFLPRLIMGID
jgi:tripartite ATP-independent transporter DctM subunit